MTPNDDMQKVVDRIGKLLALAGSNSNENEAAAAAAKAQELLSDWNLTMANIEATSQAKGTTTTDGKRVDKQHERSGLFKWQRDLWEAIAKANFCYYEAVPVTKVNALGVYMIANYQHKLIGRENNVTTAILIGEYLEQAMSRLCPYSSTQGKQVFSFKTGMSERLVERLNDKRWEMERQSRERSEQAAANNAETGLVLAQVYQTEEDLNYKFMNGEEAYERRMAYRHNRESCYCKHCVSHREWTKTLNESRSVEVEAPETVVERKKRLKQEEIGDRRWKKRCESDRRKERRRIEKMDADAFDHGRTKGSEVSLSDQVEATRIKERLA